MSWKSHITDQTKEASNTTSNYLPYENLNLNLNTSIGQESCDSISDNNNPKRHTIVNTTLFTINHLCFFFKGKKRVFIC